jgi:dihydrofolate reductase
MAQKVLAGITISLDGYITGPNDRPGAGLGEGGERLHWWVFGGPWTYASGARGQPDPVDEAYLGSVFPTAGAFLIGRSMYDAADGWGDDPGFGVPAFVVTHRPHPRLIKGSTSFEFVTDGFEAAVAKARAAAGAKNVLVMGGGDLLRQSLDAGIVDELTLTIAPVLLGAGKRLFDGMRRLDISLSGQG